jgi:Spy/CpxP family protein refolding chaperone
MRRTTFPAIVLAVAALLACGGSADSPAGPEGVRQAPAEAEIALTEDRIAASEVGAVGLAFDLEDGQRQAIAEAIARAHAALADLRARWRAGEIGAEATVAEARAIRAALDAEIAAILTPEQLAEIEARRAAFRPGLELTEEQRAAIQAIIDGWRVLVLETLQALREDELTPREAGRALAEGAREARAAVCDVLEPDQLEVFPHCTSPPAG